MRAVPGWGQKRTFAPQKAMSAKCKPEKDRLTAVSPRLLDQAASAAALRLLRQPSRPSAPRPVVNKGSAAGNGMAACTTTRMESALRSVECGP